MPRTRFTKELLKDPRAFTLLEVLVVTLIGALIAVVVIGNFLSFLNRNRFYGAVREVTEAILLARQKALSQHKYLYLDFDSTGDRFAIKTSLNILPGGTDNKFTTTEGSTDPIVGPRPPTGSDPTRFPCDLCNGDPTGPGIVNLRDDYNVDVVTRTASEVNNIYFGPNGVGGGLTGVSGSSNACIVLQDIPSGRTVAIKIGLAGIETPSYPKYDVNLSALNRCP